MKLGTFVGKEFMSIPSDVQNDIAQQIQETIINSFPNPTKYNISKEESCDFTHTISFKITNFSPDELRDYLGNTYIPKYIRVNVHLQKGYDEAVAGRCYEWTEGYKPEYDIISYSCSIDFIGDFRGYRKKNTEHYVGITRTNYSYGTELEDLTIKEGLKNISNYFYNSTPNTGTPLN